MDQLNDPRHAEVRSVLRVVGPLVAGIGLVFLVVGIANFFQAFGGHEPPRLFWCAFVGAPVLFVGTAISKFAYFGAVARYLASEAAPVGKDVTNFMVEGTRESIRDVAAAIGEGLAGERRAPSTECVQCGAAHSERAKFCSQCGASLAASKNCAACGGENEPDARYCCHCGSAVGG